MTQSIVIQIGQCGNQIGSRFWELALKEHASINKAVVYDDALSTFFKNMETSDGESVTPLSVKTRIQNLKARAIMVDMEEGVVSEILRGPMRDVFDRKQLITDISGSGNNWAVGFCTYGTRYREDLLESIRFEVEACDALQCFFLIHSLGGGTGSGLGTYILQLLAEEYPEIYRMVAAVCPSSSDDVITSPYNTVLAMRQLTDYADCVIPFENQSLSHLAGLISKKEETHTRKRRGGDARSFDCMNDLVANVMLNLTCSSRFEGPLNVDLNEITTNLVPFPKLHYLVASQAPIYNVRKSFASRKVDHTFNDVFSKNMQLISADPIRETYLGAALLARGNVHMSDVRKCISRMQSSLTFVPWNSDGWKVGLCGARPLNADHALLLLANNCCVRNTFTEMKECFSKLFNRKAHIHHYARESADMESIFVEARDSITELIREYGNIQNSVPKVIPRIQIAS